MCGHPESLHPSPPVVVFVLKDDILLCTYSNNTHFLFFMSRIQLTNFSL